MMEYFLLVIHLQRFYIWKASVISTIIKESSPENNKILYKNISLIGVSKW